MLDLETIDRDRDARRAFRCERGALADHADALREGARGRMSAQVRRHTVETAYRLRFVRGRDVEATDIELKRAIGMRRGIGAVQV